MAVAPFLNDRSRLARLGIALGVLAFFAVNIAASTMFRDVRLDVTEDRLFTLSETTKRILDTVAEPLRLQLYLSSDLLDAAPRYGVYAARVRAMLDSYSRLGGGAIQLSVIDPAPFSPEEDQAVAAGLRGVPLNAQGDLGYFGLVGSNLTDDQVLIPFFNLDREAFLEYDLTKLIADLANPDKPRIGLLDGLGAMGGPQSNFRPWQIITAMEELFDVVPLAQPDDLAALDAVWLLHPQAVDPALLYALDQYVLAGGPALIMLDPRAEAAAQIGPGGMPGQATASDLAPLLDAWGIGYRADRVLLDRAGALDVQIAPGGRPQIVPYPAWFDVGAAGLLATDPLTGPVEQVSFRSPGLLTDLAPDAEGRVFTPLIRSSTDAMAVPLESFGFTPDPAALLAGFAPTDPNAILAAWLTADLASAYPDGPPEGVTLAADAAHRSTGAARLLLIADADFAADRTWLNVQSFFGQSLGVPVADNGDLLLTALEMLSGAPGLAELRGRGRIERPFTRIEALEQRAEARFRASEQALLQELDETTRRLREIQGGQIDSEGMLSLNEDQLALIDEFRARQVEIRQELRAVQRNLRQDIEALQSTLRWLNLLTIPVVIAMIAIGLALYRRHRRNRHVPA